MFPITDQNDETSRRLSLSGIHNGERIPVPTGEKEEEEQKEEVDQEEEESRYLEEEEDQYLEPEEETSLEPPLSSASSTTTRWKKYKQENMELFAQQKQPHKHTKTM